jgi:hypothetical protein
LSTSFLTKLSLTIFFSPFQPTDPTHANTIAIELPDEWDAEGLKSRTTDMVRFDWFLDFLVVLRLFTCYTLYWFNL